MAARVGPGWWMSVAVAVARRPRLWGTAVRQVRLLARPAWWRTKPFLPVPDPEYLRFRLETQYGAQGTPAPRDAVEYLEWCRGLRASRPANKRRSGRWSPR